LTISVGAPTPMPVATLAAVAPRELPARFTPLDHAPKLA
jgi:hypothetical protein